MQSTSAFLEGKENVYFAALNTSCGFLSFFGEVFDPHKIDHTAIIKGGPGTGKSTMLKALGLQAESQGYGVEYYLCSSDPASLDGVRLTNGTFAALDGTAPHAVEPKCAGVLQSLFDAGAFWDRTLLQNSREDILKLNEEKSAHYRRAYRLLQIAGEVTEEIGSLALESLLEDKLSRAATRQVTNLLESFEQGAPLHRQVSAFGADGVFHLPTFFRRARTVVRVTPLYNLGQVYLNSVRETLDLRGIFYHYSLDYLCPSSLSSIYLPQDRILFYLGEEDIFRPADVVVNTKRFVKRDDLHMHRTRLRFLARLKEEFLLQSADSFENAKISHRKLESIYTKAMDFPRLSEAWSEYYGNYL